MKFSSRPLLRFSAFTLTPEAVSKYPNTLKLDRLIKKPDLTVP